MVTMAEDRHGDAPPDRGKSKRVREQLPVLTTYLQDVFARNLLSILLIFIMAPPIQRRKKSASAEITFDPNAREEYLTGFHKRKVQRIKHAQEEATKKERQERILQRKRVRRGLSIVARYITDPHA